jgi:methyl-accepting chemotaxis protein
MPRLSIFDVNRLRERDMQYAAMQTAERRARRTVRFKINLAIGLIFSLVVGLLIGYAHYTDRENSLQLAIAQAKGMNAFYFDSLNTLMLADAMEEREVLRQKMLELPGVVDVRINRGEAIRKRYGEGLPSAQAVDEFDRRGLAGESLVEVSEKDGERIVTVVEPYLLTRDTRGTDCLECHRRVEPGTVGGAVRISYSLQEADAMALASLWQKLGVIVLFMLLAIAALTLVLNRVVIRPVNEVVERVRDIAAGEGDLTQTLDERSGDELGELAHWFNAFVGRLRGMIGEIGGQVGELSGAATEMARMTEHTRSSVLAQRSGTDQVATAMNEMAATVEVVARNAGEAAHAAARADQQAGKGRAVMEETIAAISRLADEVDAAAGVIQRLEQESSAISVVLDVIRSIAEQTNLLALNAAIEAARAGEQGRGFAVVADEVRTLAERTQHSTQEIQRMIESLQNGAKQAVQVMSRGRQQAGESVEAAGRAGATLDAITADVDNITAMSQQIALAAEEHSGVSAEINRNVVAINEAASTTAEDSASVAAASQRLSEVAERLGTLVRQFKVD